MHKNSYQIVLTQEEVSVLIILSGSVIGGLENNPKEHTNSAHWKLRNVFGIKDCSELQEYNMTTDYIRFKDYPVTKTPQQIKIEELEKTIKEAQKQLVDANQQLEELKGM